MNKDKKRKYHQVSQVSQNKVKSILERSCFHDVWLYPVSVNTGILNCRLRDNYVGERIQGVNLSTTLTFYR